MSAMPLMVAILCVMAIAYRYYSAFLAARVADSRRFPGHARDARGRRAELIIPPTNGCSSGIISRPSAAQDR